MKTKYKIIIIVAIAFIVYWPGIPLAALSCQQITDNEICFDIASLRIHYPYPDDIQDSEQAHNTELIDRFRDMPEVSAFYAKYDDANVSVRDDHVSYFAGYEDDFLVRMNMFFDENYELDHIDFHCYFEKEHQFEIPQEDIVSKLEKYDCIPTDSSITNFEECIAAGNPAMESYPRQCRTADGLHFVEEIESQSSDCSGSAGCYTDYVNRIVDGDTIHTATLKIRLSLTNTPESYQDGFQAATEFTKSLCPVGSKIIVDQDDLQRVDEYGRVLAKVYCGDKVLNSELLYNSHANILTQYCSTSEFSGETWAQRYGCRSSVPQDTSEIIEPIPDQYTCDPSYPDFCIPFNSPDLDCGDILERDFTVIGSDPHRFDGDGDGIGCES